MSLVTRGELVADQLAHPPLGTRRPAGAAAPVRVGVTGTGKDLLVLGWSARELARERAAGSRLLSRLGVARGMRVANTLHGALATPGSLLLGDVIEEIGALDVPLGTVDGDASARAAWELVDRVEPQVLVLADARAFLAAAPAVARPWWQGVVWLRTDAGSPACEVPAHAGFTGWQRTWLAVPEATSFVAGECAASRLHPDERVVVEVVDPEARSQVPPGREGTLIVTALDLDAAPARYLTTLIVRTAGDPCDCGVAGVVLDVVR
jgi:hypothetical protein